MARKRPQVGDRPLSSPWATACRDILIASISKGQFPLAIIGLIVMSLIWRMPPEDISKLVFRIVDGSERGALLGYLFALVAVAGWYIHARYQRRAISAELNRLVAKKKPSPAKSKAE